MSNSTSAILLWYERGLLAAGLLACGAWISSLAVPGLWQALEKRSFEQEIRQSAQAKPVATPEKPSPPPPLTPAVRSTVGRLAIPRLGVDVIVREGSDDRTLSLAAGHVRGTALPGQPGNVAVAGHRDTVFRSLSGVRMKDRIRFETLQGDFTYEVASIAVVKPDETDVLKPGKRSELTLVTCFPFEFVGSAPERFIVKARLVASGKANTRTGS